MKIKYIKKFEGQYSRNTVDIKKIRLLKQVGPTCWVFSVLNDFMLQTGYQLSRKDVSDFLKYAKKEGFDLESGGNQFGANMLLTNRWNDVKKRHIVDCYFINNLKNIWEFGQFTRLLWLGNIFQYSRSSGDDFKKDREDLVLDSTNYAKTDKWHGVTIGFDKKKRKLIEYGSYGESSKYNLLWIPFKSFLGLLRGDDIKQSVYFFKKR